MCSLLTEISKIQQRDPRYFAYFGGQNPKIFLIPPRGAPNGCVGLNVFSNGGSQLDKFIDGGFSASGVHQPFLDSLLYYLRKMESKNHQKYIMMSSKVRECCSGLL